jgi:hypothetical protein
MAMQMCNRRVTQVTTNLARQLAKPMPMKVEDDHHGDEHAHIALPSMSTPQTSVSMSKYLLRGNTSITTGLSSMSLFVAMLNIMVEITFVFFYVKAR